MNRCSYNTYCRGVWHLGARRVRVLAPAYFISMARDDMTHPRDFVMYVVVQDDAVRDSICVLLDAMRFPTCGFNSANEFLRAERPLARACLILDDDMSDMSGSELLDRLRSEGLRTPAIIMTARVSAGIQTAGEQCSTIFAEKPCCPNKLIGCIAKALASDPGPA
jgi:two-component system, LuxR family, response regulator FixJ